MLYLKIWTAPQLRLCRVLLHVLSFPQTPKSSSTFLLPSAEDPTDSRRCRIVSSTLPSLTANFQCSLSPQSRMAVEGAKKAMKPTVQTAGTGNTAEQTVKSGEHTLSSAVPPEPVSASVSDTVDDDTGDEEEDDMPITPPDSTKKGPAASKQAPAKKSTAKSTSASNSATQAKQANNGVKKAEAVNGAKGEGVKADGNLPNGVKGDGKAAANSAKAKSNSAQVEPAKEGISTNFEGRQVSMMDPA